ncbi:MAG: hydroxyacid dehydrogenase [Actinobacteria bacterium]|nr:hydroxyacid dehydrogenase [Actinomycetota bacterium]
MKAVLQYRATAGFRQFISATAPDWLSVAIIDEDDRETFAREMTDTAVLLHVLEPVTAEVIAAAPRLQLIQKLGVGVNTIDLDAARAHGVGVANMPGTNTAAVAEHTLALMLAVLRRVVSVDAATRAGRGWRLSDEVVDTMGEIGGKTVGLVGFGAVGQHLAHVLRALGATVLYTATAPKDHVPAELAEWRDLPDLLAGSDIVSLHAPLTTATQQLLDAAAIMSMKRGAVLVNTARGGLVDEAALVDALRSRQLRGAGLDVFTQEPVDPANPLLTLDNVVVAPHLAWLTPETLHRSMGVAFENCRRVRDREPLLHEVVPRDGG